MKRKYLGVLMILFFISAAPLYAGQAEEVFDAIVKVRAAVPKDARTAATLGTEREGYGVVIDAKGHILTIGYLIIEADRIEITGPDGDSVGATFVGYDHNTGFGLLRTDKPLRTVPVKTGRASDVKDGDAVLVAGHGGPPAAGPARVVSRREFAGSWEYLLEKAIFTFPAYPDFAGAALINRDGQLVGIGSLITQVAVPGLGSIACNIFVPIDLLQPILADLIATGRPREPPRPWLGLNVEESHDRVFITRVTPGAPAEKAGLKSGDLILAVNGKEISGIADFYRKVWALGSAGADVPLAVLKGLQIRDVIVNSADRLQFFQMKRKGPDKT